MKLTVDWIVTTTGHGSETGADPIWAYVSVGFPNNVCVENILLENQNSQTTH